MDIKVDERTVIVFDLDDTLFNEIDFLRSAYIHISKKIDLENWQVLFAEMFSLYRHKEDVFKIISQTYGYEKKRLIALYREHSPRIQPFEGVVDLLKKIKAKKGKIAIITDGRATTQRAKLNALGIFELSDKIVISEELGTEKPHLDNYLVIEKTYQDHLYFYIADNFRKDFITPNKLGWQTIGLIDNGLNIHYDSYKFSTEIYKPQNLVFNMQEIKVV